MTNADLAPTILDADARPGGRVLDGRSVFALLRDRGQEWGRDMLIEGAGAAGVFTAIRTYRYVYVSTRTASASSTTCGATRPS